MPAHPLARSLLRLYVEDEKPRPLGRFFQDSVGESDRRELERSLEVLSALGLLRVLTTQGRTLVAPIRSERARALTWCRNHLAPQCNLRGSDLLGLWERLESAESLEASS